MKYVKFILLFLVCFNSSAQQVKFRLYRHLPCTQTELLDSTGYYIMALDGKTYNPSAKNGGETLLPSKGEYFVYIDASLLYELRPKTVIKTIEIRDTVNFALTYQEDKLTNRNVGEGVWSMYYMCDDLANGCQQDFYPDGKLRIRGNFKNGKPKDSLVFYYLNGNVEKNINYKKHHVFIWQYDTSANLIKISNNKRGVFLTDYTATEYFVGGTIKRKESRVAGIVRFKEYYPTGDLKIIQGRLFRKEYYENGGEHFTYRWKRKIDRSDPKNWQTFLIWKKEYDENSQLLESAVYECWGHIVPQPQIEIQKCDWIDEIRKFKDGIEVFHVGGINSKEYFKK